jgi:predicted HAD superfamily Cof-like phosphohydrolase
MSKERTLNEYRQNKDYGYNPPTKGARFEVPKYDPQTGELNPYYEKLTGNKNPYQLELEFEYQTDVPFVNEVEEFNRTFGKPNNYEPTIPEEKEWQFVYDFVLEELEEYRQACQNGDIVEILDALCDIAYVSLGNGVMLHGLKDKIWPAYQEVQDSNMSKSCSTEEEAMETVTVRSKEQAEPCHFEQVGDRYVVYRSRDKKVMKSINYFRPDLTQFFTNEELARTKFDNLGI